MSRLGTLRRAVEPHAPLVLAVGLGLTVTASLLAVGTVHVTTLLVLAPLALVTAVFALFVMPRTPVSPLVWLLLGLSLFSLVQSLPLPLAWVQRLSPAAAQVFEDAFTLTRTPLDHPVSLSVDPGASRVEALKWLVYAGVFLTASRLSRPQLPALFVLGAGTLAGVLSLLHGLFEIPEWFGLYERQLAGPSWAPAPLLNPNNFAGYLNLGIFAGFGLICQRKPIVSRAALGIALVLGVALVVLTGSRGGVLALALGTLVAGFLFRRGHSAIRSWVAVLGIALGGIALAVIGMTELVWRQLVDETTSKLRIIEYSTPLLGEYPWFGVGRGAFETAFPAYRSVPGLNIAQYAENFLVQWLAEWGVVVTLLAILGFALFLRTRPSALSTGILLALGVLLFQNIADLATEVASVGIATFALLGAVAKPSARQPSALGTLAYGAFLLPLVALTGRPDAVDERAQAKTLSVPELKSAILRHPADPFLPLVGAAKHQGADQNPLPFLTHALRRDPLNAEAHLLLADALAHRRRLGQALLEYRKATDYGPWLLSTVTSRVIALTPHLPTRLRAVPDGAAGIPLLLQLAERVKEQRDRWLELALARDPKDNRVHEAFARHFFEKLPACPECEGRLREHVAHLGESASGILQRARLLAHEGKADDAERYLAERCDRLPNPASCHRQRVDYAKKLAEPKRFEDASSAFTAASCAKAESCAAAFTWLGNLELSRGHQLTALSRFERAAQEAPTAAIWKKVAEIATRVGKLSRARSALLEAKRLGAIEGLQQLEEQLRASERDRLLEGLKE